jgi:N-acetylglutamate synthase-like GNAT family acetyltransferase
MGTSAGQYAALVTGYAVRTVRLEQVTGLRSALLDPTGSGHAATSAGDEHPSAHHVGAFLESTQVGVASIHPQGMPGGYKTDAWRLTGVAVEHGHRGSGNGALLVERCLEHAAESGAKAVWCLAPAGTFGFFERLGFGRSGDPIDDPDRGPHYLLYREVQPLRRDWALPGA